MLARKGLCSLFAACGLAAAGALAQEPALVPLQLDPPRSAPRPPPRWLKKGKLGTLAIRSPDAGAVVQVDGLDVGVVPLAPLQVSPGLHEVRLARPGFAELIQRVRVKPGAKALVTAKLKAVKGVLQIASGPPGARVFVDGQPVGSPPIKDLEVEPGQRRVRLEAPGQPALTETFRVRAGQSYPLFAAAAPLPDLPAPKRALIAEAPLPELPLLAPVEPATRPPPRKPTAPPAAIAAAPPVAITAAPPAAIAAAPPAAIAAPPPAPSRPPEIARTATRPQVVTAAVEAPAEARDVPLTRRWYFWGGAAAATALVAAGVIFALPAKYVEKRDPTQACGGPCVVVNR